ncbi:iron export ABC transporter permease subunit FetB [Cytobacillus sp. FSL W7-1323]|uniref:Iron export ABC transporter permease subunit FetB n=1 Tax=Cytobacillus kochii TaxID=859143 RepID=A0A248TNL5_9BACI|nr:MULTISPECIES: iron export ABC transporter permease subunit FetB [Cytobacillus]ASV69813.1 iron export ABC transporter permease subunit FetB [Cytobacillus kochii]MEA1852179.1 iron export ABC transporter permease subunit FetB [Cytobacillus sp. OWB-43]MED1606708.1 iron export ABC transporter permease subunit FetB [Cytobacillus kochii]
MTFFQLSLTLIFVLIPILLSKTFKLGLEKDVLIATIRSIIQLLAVGYVLQFVFDSESFFYIFLMIILIITAAVHNARKKGVMIKGITWKLILTYCFIEVLTQSVLISLKIIPATAQYMIPISGMIIGNAMVLSILFLNRFTAEIENRTGEVELFLSLGGTPKQAIHRQLMTSIRASTIPTIESQKTIGLVQLPGMMSGQIIAGADPVQAVMFQLLILFMLLSSAVITSIILGFLSYPTMFNERMQFVTHTPSKSE